MLGVSVAGVCCCLIGWWTGGEVMMILARDENDGKSQRMQYIHCLEQQHAKVKEGTDILCGGEVARAIQ